MYRRNALRRAHVAAALLLLSGALFFGAPASAAIEVVTAQDASPRQGESVTLRVTEAGVHLAATPVVATYAPGSQLAREVELGLTDAAGQLTFVPDAFGLVAIRAADESTTLSVRASGVPLSAVAIFAVALALMVALTGFGFRGIFAAHAGATSAADRSTT